MTHWRYTLGGILMGAAIVFGILYAAGKGLGQLFGWW